MNLEQVFWETWVHLPGIRSHLPLIRTEFTQFLQFRCLFYVTLIWVAPREKVSSGICTQRRPRSSCGSWSGPSLYPPTESLVTIDVSMVSKCPDGTLYMSGMNLNLHLAHGWWRPYGNTLQCLWQLSFESFEPLKRQAQLQQMIFIIFF